MPEAVELDPDFLDKKLAESYMIWQGMYLADKSEQEARLYCVAFMEGAKAMQRLVSQELVQLLLAEYQ